jgi:surface antigen
MNVRRLLVLGPVFAVLVLGPSAPAIASSSIAQTSGSTYTCGPDYSYSYTCLAGTGYTGQPVWGADAGHNCTAYVAYRLQQNGSQQPWPSPMGDAIDWKAAAQNADYQVNTTPADGAIAWWGSEDGADGHVAYVESYTSTSVVVSEDAYFQNKTSNGYDDTRQIKAGSTAWPDSFLHIKDVGSRAMRTYGALDFNRDGKADFVIYSGGQWAVKSGKAPYGYIVQGVKLGGAGCIPLVGDFNGDGTPDFAVDCGGQWAVKSGKTPYGYLAQGVLLGGPNDIPLVGDFNGDGKADFAIDSGGQWAVKSGVGPYNYLAQGVLLGGASDTPG